MNVDYEAALKKAWHFANNWKRVSLYFLTSLALISMVTMMVFSMLVRGAAFGGLDIILLFVAALFLGVFVEGILVHNFVHPKSLQKSSHFVSMSYSTLLGVVIFIVVLNWIINMFTLIPGGFFITLLLQIIMAMIFFFAYQEVLVAKSGFSKTIENCWSTFRKHWPVILITGIVVIVVSGVILLASAIPLILFLFSLFASSSGFSMAAMTLFIYKNAALLAVSIVSLLLGLVLSKLLGIGIATDVYMQIRKKR